MPKVVDGPASPLFESWPWQIEANASGDDENALTHGRRVELGTAPGGDCVCMGIPFAITAPVHTRASHARLLLPPRRTRWLVFQHAAEWPRAAALPPSQLPHNPHGLGGLGQIVAQYRVRFSDGAVLDLPVRGRYEVGPPELSFSEPGLLCTPHIKPRLYRSHPTDMVQMWEWFYAQGGGGYRDHFEGEGAIKFPFHLPWMNWLWAWQNPIPDVPIVGVDILPGGGTLSLFGLASGDANAHPLRWTVRRRLRLRLEAGESRNTITRRWPADWVGDVGTSDLVDVNLGKVTAVEPVLDYGSEEWASTRPLLAPKLAEKEVIIEVAAAQDARLTIRGRQYTLDELHNTVDVTSTDSAPVKLTPVAPLFVAAILRVLPPIEHRVKLRIIERTTGQELAAKLHMHCENGNYLAPDGWHRRPHEGVFQDFAADVMNYQDPHYSVYVRGSVDVNLPAGRVNLEVVKGFEWRGVRRTTIIDSNTREIVVELERASNWRARGWYSADTHVHFLSPSIGLLEGAAEDVHLVNLLAAQWGELMTNVGDFDGRSLHRYAGSPSDSEYYLWVGTENRQRMLGHISLLAYRGAMIAPLSSGGPPEGTLGGTLDVSLIEWAQQCRNQGGSVIIPHFPEPRLEHAAVITSGLADAVEMPVWTASRAIDPYALTDWYRYLNCGLAVPIAGGTDKMAAFQILGHVRTFAYLGAGTSFTLDGWQDAVRKGRTFVSTGPLLSFLINGLPMGSRVQLRKGGATLDAEWEVASSLVPVSRVELVRTGEIIESKAIAPNGGQGAWSTPIDRSGWLALLVRGPDATGKEVILAHTSAVFADCDGSPHGSTADVLTILTQIEGALTYIESLAHVASPAVARRMQLRLQQAHREFHNRMHATGIFHTHLPALDH